MKKVDYEAMLLSEFRTALAENPVAYIPLGLLEWHGEHLPLGCDILRAREMCRLIARELGGIVLPAGYFSCPGFSSYEGTITFEEGKVWPVLVALLDEVEKVGFEKALLFSAHGGPAQESLLDKVLREYKGSLEVFKIFPGKLVEMGDHAGKHETASLLALRPEVVDLDRFDPEETEIHQYDIDPEHMWPVEKEGWSWSEDIRLKDLKGLGREYMERLVVRIEELLS